MDEVKSGEYYKKKDEIEKQNEKIVLERKTWEIVGYIKDYVAKNYEKHCLKGYLFCISDSYGSRYYEVSIHEKPIKKNKEYPTITSTYFGFCFSMNDSTDWLIDMCIEELKQNGIEGVSIKKEIIMSKDLTKGIFSKGTPYYSLYIDIKW